MTSSKDAPPATGDSAIPLADLHRLIEPVMAAYAGKSDAEIWHDSRRKATIAAGVCSGLVMIAASGGTINSGADKIGTFIEKVASGLNQLEPKTPAPAARAETAETPRSPARDPLAPAIGAWIEHKQ